MQSLPTVLLDHRTAEGHHHDWLITDPTRPAGRLWTARVSPSSQHWPALGRFVLTGLPAHRRRYLDYQGPLSRQRGTVRRADWGTALCLRWTCSRIILDLHLRHCRGRIQLDRVTAKRWLAHFQGGPGHPPSRPA